MTKTNENKTVVLIPMKYLIQVTKKDDFETKEERKKFIDELYEMNVYYVDMYNAGKPIQDNLLAKA